jgi:hypothetical protein
MTLICNKKMNMNLCLIFARMKAGAPRTAFPSSRRNHDQEPIEAQFEPFLEGGHP